MVGFGFERLETMSETLRALQAGGIRRSVRQTLATTASGYFHFPAGYPAHVVAGGDDG